ncbi:JmjC domain, hydroxylase-domain-containing protein [Syncephalis fuscata]|nr:JmjC domain, hydroxylase-domain-containing protein [Syncephalis fuscata]
MMKKLDPSALVADNTILSSERAPALDLRTVATRASRANAPSMSAAIRPLLSDSRRRIYNLPEAPTYRPTEEEFRDPMQYIARIRPEAERYGICKIVPPENWQPDFHIDTETFRFRTRMQELNRMEGSTRANMNYLQQLYRFHRQLGTPVRHVPQLNKRPVDLYRLRKEVNDRGGFDEVCRNKQWAAIGRTLQVDGKTCTSLSNSLKSFYLKIIAPHEAYLAQLGKQSANGTHSPPLSSSTTATAMSEIAAGNIKTESLSTSNVSSSPPNYSIEIDEKLPTPQDTVWSDNTLRMDVLAAVAAKVQAHDLILPSCINEPIVKNEHTEATIGNSGRNNHVLMAIATESKRATGHANSIKRETGINMDDMDDLRRRSKRAKRHRSSTDSVSTPPALHPSAKEPKGQPLTARSNKKTSLTTICVTCGKKDRYDYLLTCADCGRTDHPTCLSRPPPTTKGIEEWYCIDCVKRFDGGYEFEEGEHYYSLHDFKQRADEFKRRWFNQKWSSELAVTGQSSITETDVEKEYWRLVNSPFESVEVEYGADLHSSQHGSGFSRIDRQPNDPYVTDPWNLNRLATHSPSLFQYIQQGISGMMVPWLYVGMCFSTFCWHNEDHYTYSVNYMHWGEAKTWYGIPGADALKFEAAMRQVIPELFEQQPDLLFHLVTLLSPNQLTDQGVGVYTLDQHPGDFIVTFPQSYHSGFNQGFNFAEAVNFATPDWCSFGVCCAMRYKLFRKPPVFSHDELMMTVSKRKLDYETAVWLPSAVAEMRDRELYERQQLCERYPNIQQHIDNRFRSDEQKQCYYCHAYAYLSWIGCSCTQTRITCLDHSEHLCSCDPNCHRLYLLVSDTDLTRLVDQVTRISQDVTATDTFVAVSASSTSASSASQPQKALATVAAI